MKQSVIVELTGEELVERLAQERDGLMKMRIGHTVSQLENPKQIQAKRRTIARLKTEIRKRELNA